MDLSYVAQNHYPSAIRSRQSELVRLFAWNGQASLKVENFCLESLDPL